MKKNKAIKEQALKELNSLRFDGEIGKSEIEQDGDSLRRSYRNPDFYTDRDGEEDDDWAEMTDEGQALRSAKNHFSEEVLEIYDVDVVDEGEKCWFYVELSLK